MTKKLEDLCNESQIDVPPNRKSNHPSLAKQQISFFFTNLQAKHLANIFKNLRNQPSHNLCTTLTLDKRLKIHFSFLRNFHNESVIK
jgi:hypothetical protein